ncbi:hypothetical protein DB31_7629 [Hyalangium minutum]|uniref:Uncharacterized protein n=1 Tax=Hyalangium minutum TaxID=394096 RepID=A0A085WL29_9BACT|nr:hypothetical protein DB31_7629 [Hyalangium minutum]
MAPHAAGRARLPARRASAVREASPARHREGEALMMTA